MAELPAIAFDTSVVVAALLGWHERHAVAFPLLDDALAGAGRVVLPLPALIEAYAVMTRLPPPHRLSPADAHAVLLETFSRSVDVPALTGGDVWSLLAGAVAVGSAGGATYDAHILACAHKAGATRLATFNERDFRRFDLRGLTLITPGA